VERGELAEARKALQELETTLDGTEPGVRISLLASEQVIMLAEGDVDGAAQAGLELIDLYRRSGARNDTAGAVWWMGRMFGAEMVGGEAAVEEARGTLEGAHWIQALKDPDLFSEFLRQRGLEVVPTA